MARPIDDDDGTPYAPRTMNGDILRGAEAIGQWLGITERWVRHLATRGRLPVFRLGTTICARKSTLNMWIATQERRSANGLE